MAREQDGDYIVRKYEEFIEKNGYMPKMFNAYNGVEIKDIAPTLTTRSGTFSGSGSILILEKVEVEESTLSNGKQMTIDDYLE